MTTNIIGGFLFGIALLIAVIGAAVNEAKDRKNDRPEKD